jgi:hypothetical protein
MTSPPPVHIKLTKELCTELQQFRQLRKSNNEIQRKINNAQEKLSSGGFQDVYSTDENNIETEYNSLREMYQTALKQSEKEQEYVFLRNSKLIFISVLLVVLAKLQDLIDKTNGEDSMYFVIIILIVNRKNNRNNCRHYFAK